MSARMKGRRRQAAAVIKSVTEWAARQADVQALALVGSYAHGHPRIASDVDLVLLTTDTNLDRKPIAWISGLDPEHN